MRMRKRCRQPGCHRGELGEGEVDTWATLAVALACIYGKAGGMRPTGGNNQWGDGIVRAWRRSRRFRQLGVH